MEIQQLKGFQAVAKFRNFTVAAQKTQRTQPTISLQVKSLEEELGVQLFERLGPRKVNLTAEGELLLELVSPLLNDFAHLKMRFNEARGLFHSSHVTLVTHSSVMIYLLPEVIKKFKAKFPDCRLTILNRSQKEIAAMLDNGEADFAITSIASAPSNIDYKVFSRFSRILIGTHDHPITAKNAITLEDIAQYPLILPTPESNTRKIIDKMFEERGLKYDLTMEVVGRTAIKTYVGMNLGLSILNEYYVTEDDKRKLFVKDMSRLFGKAETAIAIRKGKLLSVPAKELIKMVKESSA